MTFRTTNKTNPGRKEKQQEKTKAEKHRNHLKRVAAQLQAQKEHEERLAYLVSLYKPGKLYVLNHDETISLKLRRVYLKAGSIVLFLGVERYTYAGHCFNLKMIAGEEVGNITMNFEKAQTALKLVDIPKDLS